MAGLFKNKIIKERLEDFEIPDIEDKLTVLRSWRDAYENGELGKKTETQCEQSFNSDIFINVLGYASFPQDTYTIQPKDNVETGGGQMPDATLGHFNNRTKRVIAVVEIKDVNTPLDKSQHRAGSLTPVQQAFKYKPLFKECGFVIATNFSEIRLYKDNQLDYERFTLRELVDPKDSYFQFRKFYFLLSAHNFVVEKGETSTEKVLSAIRIEQEKITTKFYKSYKKLREDLIRDIVRNNKFTKSVFYPHVVQKAQKIIDRLVFICFFEDSGFLPENKLMEVVEYAQKGVLEEPIWNTLKNFFRAVDEGSQKLQIPDGYNGELFKDDEDLNRLKIGDEICGQFVEFSKYDFQEDLSVSILGHIFEQSISDLERLRNYSEGKEVNSDSKRKKEGIFYTPEYIVDEIIKNSLGRYLEDKEQQILLEHKLDSKRIKTDKAYDKKLLGAYNEYIDWVRGIKILDPACGSGAFLVRVFDYLLAENKRVAGLMAELTGGNFSLMNTEGYVKSLLKNNIYGVDLNEESVEITKLSLWLKSAKRGQKLVTLKDNIKCGNSLIDDQSIAKDKAFNWSREFPEVMNGGGFDIVVGNPPWGSKISMKDAEFIANRFGVPKKNLNLFSGFVLLSLELLKVEGIAELLIPKVVIKNSSYYEVRKSIIQDYNLECISDFGKFPGVASDAISLSIRRGRVRDEDIEIINYTSPESVERSRTDRKFYSKSPTFAFSLDINETKQTIISKLASYSKLTENGLCLLKRGIELGQVSEIVRCNSCGKHNEISKKYYSNQEKNCKYCKQELNSTPFCISSRNQTAEYSIPAVSGKEIGKYLIREKYYIPTNLSGIDYKNDIFMGDRLFIKRIATKPEGVFVGSEDSLHAFNTVYVIYNIKDVNPRALLGILNSKLLSFYYENVFNLGMSLTSQITVEYLKELPIAKGDEEQMTTLHNKVVEIQNIKAELYSRINSFTDILKQEFSLEAVSQKLESFYDLSFEDFIGFLPHKEISFEKKSELHSFFVKERDEALNIKSKIDGINNEIDTLVFDIYKLTDEERHSVLK